MIDFTDLFTDADMQAFELEGFDPDLTGFDCEAEVTCGWSKWTCPFRPGCGVTRPQDCPLKARLSRIARAPKRVQ
jgi:hypothetical protein